MTDNSINIHNGSEVDEVIESLSRNYVVHYDLIDVWRHGDPTNRRRLFIVGLHRELGSFAYSFKLC